ncbi:1576_t:CDS:1 [Ambispora leptoticha]|uniref:1576_t:CDS:1 n=1 Tax=Ambispora leptoticha TaxID=144679 RepID=A0A9N9D9E0_9GLOM|nr:1576_t:CDS:1 [Ambispora leptoticha]
MLLNGMCETTKNIIKFPEITTPAMKIILEFLYTGDVSTHHFAIRTAIDTFHAANYFILPDLEKMISEFIIDILKKEKEKDKIDCIVEFFSSMISRSCSVVICCEIKVYREIWNAIVNTQIWLIPFERMTFEMLRILLSETFDFEDYFLTTEYDLFRYVLLWAARRISQQAFLVFSDYLPLVETIDYFRDQILKGFKNDVSSDPIIAKYRDQIHEDISQLLAFIDLRRIPPKIIATVIRPLKLISDEICLNACDYHAKAYCTPKQQRGLYHYKSLQWDKLACGSKLKIYENSTRVSALADLTFHQSVRTKQAFWGEGVYEWDVIIEETCFYAWVGICATECVNYEKPLGLQQYGWVISSGGFYQNYGRKWGDRLPFFGKNSKVTVHLDMTNRTCAFSINNVRMPVAFNNLPEKVYPAVSLVCPGRFHILPHKPC